MAEHEDVQFYIPTHTLGRMVSDQPLRFLSEHVQEYTSRTLTLERDIHNAFTGIESALSASVMRNTTFLFGLPAAAFDWGLLWSGMQHSLLTRRSEFPSWTWMGWKGQLRMTRFGATGSDSLWLRMRTWIDWRLFHNGSSISVWHPQDMTQIWVDPLFIRGSTDTRVLIDEQAHQDDDNKWDDHRCPSYGIPTHGNPFGRMFTQKLLFLQSYMEHPQSIVSQDFGMLPNYPCLRISTIHCLYHIEIASLIDKEPWQKFSGNDTYCILRGKDSNIYGLAERHDGLQIGSSSEQQEIEVLILSYSAPGVAEWFGIDNLDADCSGTIVPEDTTDFIDTFDGVHYWDMMNTLLVRRLHDCPLIVERVGIGALRKSGIEASLQSPRWTEVFLA